MVATDKVLVKLDFGKILDALKDECTLAGSKEMAQALRPSDNLRQVKTLLRETDEGRTLLRLNPLFSLRGAREIRPYLERCERGGVLNAEELLEIRDTLKTGRQIRVTLLEEKGKNDQALQNLFLLQEAAERITPQKPLEDQIGKAIGDDGEVRDTASDELARLRRAKQTTQQRIRESLDGILRNAGYQKMLQENLITTRGDRYVVPVKAEYVSAFPGIVHDQSASGATIFMEPTVVVRLDNELRETILKEKREVERILQQLTAAVSVVTEVLSATYNAMLHIDFILAKARYSEKIDGAAPVVLHKPEVSLLRARHPLLTGKIVPLTVELGLTYRFLVVTGPNTGGKTVALKTVGLMASMAQSGLHIPAEPESKLGIFGQILIDIGDEQSMEQSLSTFSGHMTTIVDIINKADSASLVLFDEIGAGTDPIEGVALAMAILMELIRRGCCGIATTHYGALKEFAYNTPEVENASVEFDAETLRPTYRLLVGIPGRSNAFNIAQRLGLKEEVLEQARSYLSQRQQQETDLLENLEGAKRQMEREQHEIEDQQRAAAARTLALEKKAQALEERQEELLRKARDEAAEILRAAKQEADVVIKELKEARKKERREQEEAANRARSNLKRHSQRLSGYGKNDGQGPRMDQVWPGQTVYMPNLRQKGQIIGKIDDKEVVVQAGILKLTVPLAEIRLVDETRTSEHFNKTIQGTLRGESMAKAVTLRSEIDVRGNLVEEAVEMLDKYLDDAVLTGIHQVGVIHGKGTGALRGGVHSFLKRHPHVKSYRLGEFGEGDSGVTIIELK